jgi:hypothetical protein
VSENGIDTAQPVTEVDLVEAKETWSEYRLADGTRLRVKLVMIAVFRANDQTTADGEPVYNMKTTLVTDVRATPSHNRVQADGTSEPAVLR